MDIWSQPRDDNLAVVKSGSADHKQPWALRRPNWRIAAQSRSASREISVRGFLPSSVPAFIIFFPLPEGRCTTPASQRQHTARSGCAHSAGFVFRPLRWTPRTRLGGVARLPKVEALWKRSVMTTVRNALARRCAERRSINAAGQCNAIITAWPMTRWWLVPGCACDPSHGPQGWIRSARHGAR